MKRNFSEAFTLAEILIVVGVIGVVATTALPPLIENINERIWNARSMDTLAKLSEATNQMKVDDMLSGYANTDGFINELQKKIRITKRCDSQNLDKCFTPKFKLNEDTIETKNLKTIKNLWKTSADTNNNTVGLITMDGVPMVMAFDQKCERLDPYSNTPRNIEGISATLSCLHVVYDTNGAQKPNAVNKDIKTFNVVFSKGLPCVELTQGGLCVATTTFPELGLNTCDPNRLLDNGKQVSYYDTYGTAVLNCHHNQWAGAKKNCDDVEMRLPTMAELAKIADEIYKTQSRPIGALEDRTGLIFDNSNRFQIPYGSFIWSSQATAADTVYNRVFSTNGSTKYSNTKNGNFATTPMARCVSD